MAYRLRRPKPSRLPRRPKHAMGALTPARLGPAHNVLHGPPKGVIREPAGPQTPAPVATPSRPRPMAPPPETLQGATARSDASTAYGTAVSGFKNQLVQAALRLGSPEIINALMSNPDYAEYAGALQQGVNDPNSTMATLGRQETQGLKDIDVNRNEGNTYFSGFRLQDRGKLSDEMGAQRSGAINDYRGVESGVKTGLGGALSDYNRAMNEALGIDISSALDREPEPAAAAKKRAPSGPPKGRKPSKRARISKRPRGKPPKKKGKK